MEHSLIEQLAGPWGGAIAGAFGIGCAAGWTFAMSAIVKEAKIRIGVLEASEKEKDAKIEAQNKRIQDILTAQIK